MKMCRKTTATTPIKPLNFDESKFESSLKAIFPNYSFKEVSVK